MFYNLQQNIHITYNIWTIQSNKIMNDHTLTQSLHIKHTNLGIKRHSLQHKYYGDKDMTRVKKWCNIRKLLMTAVFGSTWQCQIFLYWITYTLTFTLTTIIKYSLVRKQNIWWNAHTKHIHLILPHNVT